MQTRRMVVNTIVAALYVALTAVFSFMSFGAIQFRVAEMLNHLVGYHKTYKYGVLIGVFLSNLLFSTLGAWDLVFGLGQSVLAFFIIERFFRPGQSETKRMLIVTAVFVITMFLVAIELYIVLDLPFWYTYVTAAFGEAVVLLVAIPVMQYLNKLIHFTKKMEA